MSTKTPVKIRGTVYNVPMGVKRFLEEQNVVVADVRRQYEEMVGHMKVAGKVLQKTEWSGESGSCQICGVVKNGVADVKHAHDCDLAFMLGTPCDEAPVEKGEPTEWFNMTEHPPVEITDVQD